MQIRALNFTPKKLWTSARRAAEASATTPVYAVTKALPEGIRGKLMRFLDAVMPKKKYYCEKVSDSFYRGSEVGLSEIKALSDKGIKRIVDLKFQNLKDAKKLKIMCEKHGISYINIPLNVFEKPGRTVDDLKSIVKTANVDNPTYVHCKYGEDRTGFVVGLHHLFNENWSVKDVVQDMVKRGYKKHLFPHLADRLEELAALNIL